MSISNDNEADTEEVPESVSLSISHKKDLAVAIIGWKENQS